MKSEKVVGGAVETLSGLTGTYHCLGGSLLSDLLFEAVGIVGAESITSIAVRCVRMDPSQRQARPSPGAIW